MINNILAFSDVMATILSVLVAFLVLLLTITVHEFGHYVVGKLLKFKITEFAIGMGPAIFKKTKKNGEVFSIRLLPLGGFCAFEGEDDAGSPGKEKEDYKTGDPKPDADAPAPLSENAFDNKKPWQRILVLLAGGVTNVVFAIIVVALSFSIYGQSMISVGAVASGNAVENEYCLVEGDRILEIDGKYVYLTTDLNDYLNGKKQGDKVSVLVENDGKRLTRQVYLRNDVTVESMTDFSLSLSALGIGTTITVESNEGSAFPNGSQLISLEDGTRIEKLSQIWDKLAETDVGDSVKINAVVDGEERVLTIVVPENIEDVKGEYASNKERTDAFKKLFNVNAFYAYFNVSSNNVKLGFFEGLYRAPVYGVKTMLVTLKSIGGLFNGSVSVTDMSGPVGTIKITSQAVKMGFSSGLYYVLEIMALIGISIGVFNLLPVPALDGGRIVFVVIEWIRGKPINKKVEAVIHFVGLITLIAFAVLVDLLKLF